MLSHSKRQKPLSTSPLHSPNPDYFHPQLPPLDRNTFAQLNKTSFSPSTYQLSSSLSDIWIKPTTSQDILVTTHPDQHLPSTTNNNPQKIPLWEDILHKIQQIYATIIQQFHLQDNFFYVQLEKSIMSAFEPNKTLKMLDIIQQYIKNQKNGDKKYGNDEEDNPCQQQVESQVYSQTPIYKSPPKNYITHQYRSISPPTLQQTNRVLRQQLATFQQQNHQLKIQLQSLKSSNIINHSNPILTKSTSFNKTNQITNREIVKTLSSEKLVKKKQNTNPIDHPNTYQYNSISFLKQKIYYLENQLQKKMDKINQLGIEHQKTFTINDNKWKKYCTNLENQLNTYKLDYQKLKHTIKQNEDQTKFFQPLSFFEQTSQLYQKKQTITYKTTKNQKQHTPSKTNPYIDRGLQTLPEPQPHQPFSDTLSTVKPSLPKKFNNDLEYVDNSIKQIQEMIRQCIRQNLEIHHNQHSPNYQQNQSNIRNEHQLNTVKEQLQKLTQQNKQLQSQNYKLQLQLYKLNNPSLQQSAHQSQNNQQVKKKISKRRQCYEDKPKKTKDKLIKLQKLNLSNQSSIYQQSEMSYSVEN